MGLSGLTESEVNLGVAKHLKEMLASGGAKVILTRERDTRVVQDEDAPNKEDLRARVKISNENKADLFISLHHNADILPKSQKNQIETYYAIEGKVASLDLARYIHRHLVKNLGIKDNKIIPGNFCVLRENKATSVLLEPSYLSNEYIEYRLKDDRARQLEASAIFAGIAEYLSKGIPKITEVWPDNEVIHTAYPRIEACLEDDSFGPGIDPSTVRIWLNGNNLEYYFNKDTGLVTAIPELPLKNGPHSLEIQAKNYNGNALRPQSIYFTVDLPPTMIEVSPVLSAIPPEVHFPLALEIAIKDEYGNPVNDGYEVGIEIDKGETYSSTDKTVNGKVITYVIPGEGDAVATISCGEITKEFHWPREEGGERRFAILHIEDSLSKEPIQGARLILEDKTYSFNRDGYLLVEDPESEGIIQARGYIPKHIELSFNEFYLEEQISLRPVFEGILFDKTIAIDPEFGGMESGIINPDGVRGADVNLLVAQFLTGYLEQAGARPVMTREEDTTLSPLERLLKIEAAEPDILVIIGHENENSAYSQHYPSSKKGRTLASCIQRFIAEGISDSGVLPATRYLIVQTSMPAVYIHPSSLKDLDTAHLRAEAYNIFCGILEYYLKAEEGEKGLYEISGVIRDSEDKPLENVITTLNGCIEIQIGKDGRYRLYIPKTDSTDTHHLLFTKTGYEPKEISIRAGNFPGEKMDIVLQGQF